MTVLCITQNLVTCVTSMTLWFIPRSKINIVSSVSFFFHKNGKNFCIDANNSLYLCVPLCNSTERPVNLLLLLFATYL